MRRATAITSTDENRSRLLHHTRFLTMDALAIRRACIVRMLARQGCLVILQTVKPPQLGYDQRRDG